MKFFSIKALLPQNQYSQKEVNEMSRENKELQKANQQLEINVSSLQTTNIVLQDKQESLHVEYEDKLRCVKKDIEKNKQGISNNNQEKHL